MPSQAVFPDLLISRRLVGDKSNLNMEVTFFIQVSLYVGVSLQRDTYLMNYQVFQKKLASSVLKIFIWSLKTLGPHSQHTRAGF
jgi:hypothetical protein